MLHRRLAILAVLLLSFVVTPAQAADGPPRVEIKPLATVVNIEGQGTARVRKKTGTESVLANAQELSAGDKLTTGPGVLVQLMLPDGTLVRVGANSEYKIESVESKTGFMAWVFSLTKGTVRALVEKGPADKQSKFRVNTPAGTMGVRGTELVLTHNPDTKTTTLFTIEGRVELGALDCAAKKSCVMVTTGQSASISAGQGKPAGPVPLNLKDLVSAGMTVPSDDDQSPGAQAARAAASMMSVIVPFSDRKSGINGTAVSALDDAALRDMVLKTSSEMMAIQDTLMDRDEETRRAMNDAVADGSFDERIRLAEKKEEELTGVKKTDAERKQERLSGVSNAKKIAVAKHLVDEKSKQSAGSDSEAKESGKVTSGKGMTTEEMASRLAASEAKRKKATSGASRAVVGSDISALMKDAEEQIKKAESQIAKNAQLVKEATLKEAANSYAKGSATATSTTTSTKTTTRTSTAVATATPAVVDPGSASPSPSAGSCAAATGRCEKALLCDVSLLKCRIQKSAQYNYCEVKDCATGQYMDWAASNTWDITYGYKAASNALGVKSLGERYNGGVVEKDRSKVRKVEKRCVTEIIPCNSKIETGVPCNLGNGNDKFRSREVCYEVYVDK